MKEQHTKKHTQTKQKYVPTQLFFACPATTEKDCVKVEYNILWLGYGTEFVKNHGVKYLGFKDIRSCGHEFQMTVFSVTVALCPRFSSSARIHSYFIVSKSILHSVRNICAFFRGLFDFIVLAFYVLARLKFI